MAQLSLGNWIKMTLVIGGVGGIIPWALWKSLPSEAEMKKRYPEDELLAATTDRERNAQAMGDYITKMKEYSKDNRNVWLVMKEEQDKARKEYKKKDLQKQRVAKEELAARRAEIQQEIMSGSSGKS